MTNEYRSEHCKFYTYPKVKRAIQRYANAHGLTFSEAAQKLVLIGIEREGF